MSELEAVLGAGRRALEEKGVSFSTVLKALSSRVEPDKAKVPQAPAAIPMTDELVHALTVLPAVFGKVNPTSVCQLSDEENRALLEENRTLDTILKALTTRLEDTKAIARNHIHMTAVANGDAAAGGEVDQRGHVLVAGPGEPYKVAIPGTDQAWSLQYVAPRTEISDTLLEQLRETDNEAYLALTKTVRVFDEEKAIRSIRKNPGLLRTVHSLIKKGRPSTSLFVRKQK